MKKYNLSYSEFNQLCEQTRGDVVDCVEGCLIDSYIFTFTNSNGVDFVVAGFEHYLNEWSSDLTVFIAHTERDTAKVWKMWEEFAERNRDDDD